MGSIIEVKDLSKSFIINHESREKYTALRDVISTKAKKIFSPQSFIKSNESKFKEEFWALKDLSFEIRPGDRVGIIGRNGAGKSTLLKILSRITEPTRGEIKIKGRVASLLEVGTGFHPELTGKENIFLNGAILGMSRSEIKSKYDEIVDFAEVEKFLDTPVKRYSSGMYVRLAFAVAAHLEPEILIVDEVLAVGDAQFQKKCLGKMEQFSKHEGRTVLFVSHNMQAISNLCTTCIYLADGSVVLHDKVDRTIEKYLSQGELLNTQDDITKKIESAKPDVDFKLTDIQLLQENKPVITSIVNGKNLTIKIFYHLLNRVAGFRVFLDLCDDIGNVLFRSFHDENTNGIMTFEPGSYESEITIPANLLAPITYDVKLLFGIHNIRMLPPAEGIVIRINVEQTGLYNKAYNGLYTTGKLCPLLQWQIKNIK